jgi:rhodanese-related sulfurtransferase
MGTPVSTTAALLIAAVMVPAASAGYQEVTAGEAWSLFMLSEVVTVDVSPMYDDGHLPGAVSAPLPELEESLTGWDSGLTYLVYCHSEEASRRGAQTLVDSGFESVSRLEGNFKAWVDAGYPVEIPGEYMDVGPGLAHDLVSMDNNLVVVDVSRAYGNGHLPGAVSAPVSTLEEAMTDWDMEDHYLVYCHGDAPSIRGARALVNAGFTTVYRLEGNYGAWVDAGHPVETE